MIWLVVLPLSPFAVCFLVLRFGFFSVASIYLYTFSHAYENKNYEEETKARQKKHRNLQQAGGAE